jgi:hypothetical protein
MISAMAKVLANTLGNALAVAYLHGGNPARDEIYNEVYCPLVIGFRDLYPDYPGFDSGQFSYSTAVAEADSLQAARECGRDYVAG